MICFHSLNYWYLQQHEAFAEFCPLGCDLLSFFELLIFTTTACYFLSCVIVLWFAFILWTTDIYNNHYLRAFSWSPVVICFHSLNYWYLQQHFSRCIVFKPLLWFAFILWTTDIYNNLVSEFLLTNSVVICFHSLNYWYLQQLFCKFCHPDKRCDLLSFFELLIFTTTSKSTWQSYLLLWFAFILWTTDIYNNIH